MNQVDVWIEDESLGPSTLVGRLSKAASRTGDTVSFEYDGDWLGGTSPVAVFPLDPELQLAGGPHFARAGANALTGAFIDCCPDRWGKRLMDRREAIEARQEGRPRRNLRDWDYLVGVHDEGRMGALRLINPATGHCVDDRALAAPPITALRELEAIADQVERGEIADDAPEMVQWVRRLVAPGASLGGARPKASFRDPDGQLWLAKFPSADDSVDVGLWEFLTYQLSIDAGINMPEARLLSLSQRGHTYAVRRFDRTPQSRRAYASAMTVLDRTESDGASYLDLIEAIEVVGASTRIGADLEQLFRRVLFNILIGNRDDHLRNHGFLREGDGWQLSPAFDVNPNPHKDEHVLAIDEADTAPDSGVLLVTADFYRLTRHTLGPVVEQVRAAVRGWQERARALDARGDEIAVMQAVIDPDR